MRVGMRHVEEIFISDYSFFLIISWILAYVANGVTSVLFGGVFRLLVLFQFSSW